MILTIRIDDTIRLPEAPTSLPEAPLLGGDQTNELNVPSERFAAFAAEVGVYPLFFARCRLGGLSQHYVNDWIDAGGNPQPGLFYDSATTARKIEQAHVNELIRAKNRYLDTKAKISTEDLAMLNWCIFWFQHGLKNWKLPVLSRMIRQG